MREAERMFHLGRIHGADLTETAFEPPANFDIQSYANRGWSASFYEDMKRDFPRIRIRVPGAVADALANHWLMRHAEREEVKGEDNGDQVILSYHDHREGPLNFVYRFGPDFEILEPADARQEVADMAARMLARHSSQQGE
jgi:predicted DNA-binding transcriptional regulator YafY